MRAENLSEITDYILGFLLGESNHEAKKHIGYVSDEKLFSRYKLVIIPSNYFEEEVYGTVKSIPLLPLETWEGTPLLFGTPVVEKSNDTTIVHADIIASTFFLISRYEEIICRGERDQHGRFPGTSSLPFKGGFLQRPIVDEYGKVLRRFLHESGLKIQEPEEKINKIYLTHDVDQLAHYRNFRGMAGAVVRFLMKPQQTYKAVLTYFGGIKHDPWYTFPLLFELAKGLKREIPLAEIETIVFIKTGGGKLKPDKPLHDIKNKDFDELFKLCKQNDVKIGLHPSYQAGMDLNLIAAEKELLDKVLMQETVFTRNHYLCNREPEDMQALIDAGLTDDFTMAYADQGGFRLGTCRPVKWINPATLELTSLTLHPVTMMDRTLDDGRYMNLKVDEAFAFAKNMINEVKKHNGELALLWHNTSIEKDNGMYHLDLYKWMINYLKTNI